VLSRSGLESAEMSLRLTYAPDGTVTDVSVSKSSRNRDLDRAAQQWARRIKMCQSAGGVGILPIVFRM
jgi:periplasmic protein TonB